MSVFTAHSFRSAASPAAKSPNVPIDKIMAIAGWQSSETFREFLDKAIIADKGGIPVTKEDLNEVAKLSGAMTFGNDYLPQNITEKCERIIPDIDSVHPQDAAETYMFLKANFNIESH
eukprot:gene13066-14411_t